MALARPVRAMIVFAVILWCFVVFQIFKPMPERHGPGDRYLNFERDPNLDREPFEPATSIAHVPKTIANIFHF